MPVIYDGKKIIPGPFVSIRKEKITREDGKYLSPLFVLTVVGTLVAEKGSPNSSGVFHTASGYPSDEVIDSDGRLRSILRKQEAIRKLFDTDGRTFEIQPYDGSAPLKCNPRIRTVDFPDGLWFETAPYTITMEADVVEGLIDANLDDDYLRVSKVGEEWNLEPLDETKGTYRLSHALSATGKLMYDETGALLEDKEAWEHARDFVLDKGGSAGKGLGLGLVDERMYGSGVIDGFGLQAFNYLRTQAINETAGIFSANETWVCFDPGSEPPAIHDYTANLRYNSQDGKTIVSLDGSITGLEKRDNTTRELISTRWENAHNKYVTYIAPYIYSTAQSIVGTGTAILNPIQLSKQVGLNMVNGTINYQYEYDNRATPNVPNALSEVITVSNDNASDVFAQIPVLGRPYGPVLQDIDTITSKVRTISIEVQMPATVQGFIASAPDTNFIVSALMPVSSLGVFLDKDNETWTPTNGRYTRNTTFVWE